MAEAQLRQFLDKVRQLNAFVAMSEADPRLRQELRDCEHHDQVVALARRCGFEIGRRWGEPLPGGLQADPGSGEASPGSTGCPVDLAGPSTLPEPQDAAVPPQARFPDGAGTASASLPGGEVPPRPEGASPLSRPLPSGLPHESVLVQRSAAGESLLSRPAERQAAFSGGFSPVDQPRSLLVGPCPSPGEERTEVLIETPLWRLERIHSCSSQSPAGFWYEQTEDEWVLLLQGTAALRFADQPSDQRLLPGDSLWIRAGRRHRVTATDPAPGTIWLALFWPRA